MQILINRCVILAKKIVYQLRSNWVLHPFLLAIWPCLFLYSYNIEEMDFQDSLPATFIIFFTITLFFLAAKFFLRDSRKAGFLSSGILIWFFVYGHIYIYLRGFNIGDLILGRNIIMIPAWTILIISLVTYLLFNKSIYSIRNTYIANMLSVFLLMMCLVNIGIYQVQHTFIKKAINNNVIDEKATNIILNKQNNTELNINRVDSTSHSPNIFYIILDSYTSNNELINYFDYNNQDFIDYLSNKGFYIAHQSNSNYAFTGLSLSSSLNMEYLNYLSKQEGEQSKDKSVLSGLIENNKLMNILTNTGYDIQKLGSWYKLTNYSDKNTTLIKKLFFTEFTMVLLKTTLLNAFSEQFMAPMLRDGVLETFEGIKKYANTKTPTFTFAHIICPHPPFIFNENGGSISLLESVRQKLNPGKSYIDQLRFINKKTLETVNFLIESSAVKPIIIIQGDHGGAYVTRDLMASPSEPPATFLKAQMGILNAYYVPDNVKHLLYPSISPVNSFRKILNGCFGTKFAQLPDSSYYSRHISPYKFTNVTTIVK